MESFSTRKPCADEGPVVDRGAAAGCEVTALSGRAAAVAGEALAPFVFLAPFALSLGVMSLCLSSRVGREGGPRRGQGSGAFGSGTWTGTVTVLGQRLSASGIFPSALTVIASR